MASFNALVSLVGSKSVSVFCKNMLKVTHYSLGYPLVDHSRISTFQVHQSCLFFLNKNKKKKMYIRCCYLCVCVFSCMKAANVNVTTQSSKNF